MDNDNRVLAIDVACNSVEASSTLPLPSQIVPLLGYRDSTSLNDWVRRASPELIAYIRTLNRQRIESIINETGFQISETGLERMLSRRDDVLHRFDSR